MLRCCPCSKSNTISAIEFLEVEHHRWQICADLSVNAVRRKPCHDTNQHDLPSSSASQCHHLHRISFQSLLVSILDPSCGKDSPCLPNSQIQISIQSQLHSGLFDTTYVARCLRPCTIFHYFQIPQRPSPTSTLFPRRPNMMWPKTFPLSPPAKSSLLTLENSP